MRAILALLLITMLAEPALAQAVTSIDTELVKGRCCFIDDDGEVGDYALKRCPGLAGARVYTDARVMRVSLSFRWGKAKAEDVVSGYSLGTKLEWHGVKSKQGFKPYAVIVRVIVRDDETDKTYNVLGVIRMEARNACLFAVVDEAENEDALALARKTADAEAPTLDCAEYRPRIVGTASQWAQKTIGDDGDPPK
jgi:hypothetical protein